MNSFEISKKDFYNALLRLKKIGGIRKNQIDKRCNITVTPNKVTVEITGSLMYINCVTTGEWSSEFYFLDFFEMVKNNLSTDLKITIDEKTISVNNSKLISTNTLLNELKPQEINSSPGGYLNASYNIEELPKNQLIFTNKDETNQFSYNDIFSTAKKTKKTLKEFNVSEDEIIALILKQLKKIEK